MNKKKYTQKTQKRIQRLVKVYYIIVNVFSMFAALLIIAGGISESWIRLVSGVILLIIVFALIGVVKDSIEEIEESGGKK